MNRNLLSHLLAHAPGFTPRTLADYLVEDKLLGFDGMVIVPALADKGHSPRAYARISKATSMQTLTCGFNAGNGPDPLSEDYKLVIENLRGQLRFVTAMAEKDCGPMKLVGPVHTWHMAKRETWDQGSFERWMDHLQKLAEEFNVRILMEPLNKIEDGTPTPFRKIFEAASTRDRLGLHWDMGHAHMQGLTTEDLLVMASKVGFLEWANIGRNPLRENLGINFSKYAAARTSLPKNCEEGVEPFDQSVIQAFGLQELCTTTTPGSKCLALDIAYLRGLGVRKATD